MNLDIDKRYSLLSMGVFLHLLHNNEKFKDAWIKKYPHTKNQAENFFKNENCGCRPRLIQAYKQTRFEADVFIVSFINENEGCINFDEIEKKGARDVRGHVFSIPASEVHLQDFLASIHQKNADYDHFITTVIKDKILVTFF